VQCPSKSERDLLLKSFDEKIKTAGEKAKVKLNAHRKELKDKLAAIDAKLDWAFA